MMKKMFFLIAMSLSMFSLNSCKDEEREFIEWEIINEAPNDIKVTDDPMMYVQVTVTANEKGGNVVLNCTNFGDIKIEDANESGVYTDNGCKFTASVSDGHRLSIHLDPVGLLEIPGMGKEKRINVTAKKGKRTVICGINVERKSSI